jgi:hypothetical protein
VLASSQVNGMVVESPATMTPIGKNKKQKTKNKKQNIKIFKNKQIT